MYRRNDTAARVFSLCAAHGGRDIPGDRKGK